MIFNLRGTSGSGKSYLLRKITSQFNQETKHYREGRKQPLYVVFSEPKDPTRECGEVAVVGHYNIPCGGCDTLKTCDEVAAIVRKLYEEGKHVIFEGVIYSTEFNRTAQMIKDGFPLVIVNILTPLEQCLDSILDRRKAKSDNPKPVNPFRTTQRIPAIARCCERLREQGGVVVTLDREAAYTAIFNQLLPKKGG